MTMEDRVTQLEEQTAALSVQTLADEAPSGYYTSRYSGEQIDNLLSGLGFEIGGSYANLAAIQAAFPNGDTHAYQAKDTMDIYVWNTETRAWESVGKLQGPVGPKGDKGDPGGPPGPQGERGPGSNPNLLDNWYFVDPINQRGLNEYATFGYTIDRWKFNRASDKLTLTQNWIRVEASEMYGGIWQQFDSAFGAKPGTKFTFSVLFNSVPDGWYIDTHLVSKDSIVKNWNSIDTSQPLPLISIVIDVPNNYVPQPDDFFKLFIATNILNPQPCEIIAAKLELGTEQTLARQDSNGNWILNDPPPNYALELLKCQRYYLGFKRWEFWPVIDIQLNYVDFTIPTPVEMRAAPAIINLVSNWLDSSWQLSTAVNGRSVIRARAYKDNHGLAGPLSPVEAYDYAGLSADL